jgi:hypothetical protein
MKSGWRATGSVVDVGGGEPPAAPPPAAPPAAPPCVVRRGGEAGWFRRGLAAASCARAAADKSARGPTLYTYDHGHSRAVGVLDRSAVASRR